MAEGYTISDTNGDTDHGDSEYYNPNYEPYTPYYYYYPDYSPVIVRTVPIDIDNGPMKLWPLLYELRQIKQLLHEILDK